MGKLATACHASSKSVSVTGKSVTTVYHRGKNKHFVEPLPQQHMDTRKHDAESDTCGDNANVPLQNGAKPM
jgi:hypothetical protein